ncbi:cyclopropane-fatty-acyl-phospholipid synthase family protein [Aurantimonas sp. HBX-1]|uniref:SAM-dependent methyltransferase n=1 Tax=Aurantimonas sp. HBX-1 TaxID=2906072 RepID=UPI001F2B4E66|nr:class I SAM-dependent methyltransferase [Aurantimonas sp. HBX-1]UIJ71050.1 class I SAM-dependent methyltransferase [Aurantimonas sp. HBX-1]
MRLDARLRNLFRRSEPVVPPAEKLRSMVCRSEHFDTAWYRSGAEAIAAGGADLERFGPDFAATFATTWQAMTFGPDGPAYRHRKMWEWAAITRALGERGKLRPGSRGCGFAVGFEPLPSLFAARGAEVLATDWVVEEATDWNISGQQATTASHLRWPNLIDEASFDARVTFRSVDMRNLDGLAPGSFDFVWSSCSLEHLGDLEAGLRFIEQSAALLKPGGVAVHTTEFNVSSKTATIESGPAVIYRESDLLTLPDRLAAQGVTLEPFDLDIGTDAADLEPDAPPYYAGGRQHVKLRYGDHVMTSILLVATKN